MKKTKNIENSQNLDVVHFIEPKCYDVVMQQNNVVNFSMYTNSYDFRLKHQEV